MLDRSQIQWLSWDINSVLIFKYFSTTAGSAKRARRVNTLRNMLKGSGIAYAHC
jgi:hypothetical protein